MVGESPVARLHIVVRAERGHMLPDVDESELETQVAAVVRSWDDDLAEEALCQLGEERAQALLAMCGGERIPQTYKTDVPATAAVDDLNKVLELRESGEERRLRPVGVGGLRRRRADRRDGRARLRRADGHRVWRLSIYRTGAPITLTDVLPRLQHMGLEVVDEHPYEFAARRAVLDL